MKTSLETPHMKLAILSRGYVVSRAIHTIARLNIADYMSDEPITIDVLAEKTHTKAQLLERLLNFLESYGLFTKNPEGYALTELSRPLKSNDPHSIKDVLNMVDDSWWQAFAQMDKGLQNGSPPFNIQHEMNFFDFLEIHPEKQANYDRGMAKLSTYDNDSIADACDFGQFKTLVDLGGGRGGLTKAIANRFNNTQVRLFDTPQVIQQLNPEEYPSNVQFESGDFFREIPTSDAYMIKGVLHDFNDEMVHEILNVCKKNMPAQAHLFIAEQVIPDLTGPHPNKTMDIVMMVLLGGRQRTLEEWKLLTEEAGFRFVTSYPTESIFTVMEFVNE